LEKGGTKGKKFKKELEGGEKAIDARTGQRNQSESGTCKGRKKSLKERGESRGGKKKKQHPPLRYIGKNIDSRD